MKNEIDNDRIGTMMTDYLAGELSPKDQERLELLIQSSEDCRNEFEDLKKVWELTEQTLQGEELSIALTPANYDNIFTEQKKKPGETKKSLDKKKLVKKYTSIPKPKQEASYFWMKMAASLAIIGVIASVLYSISMPAYYSLPIIDHDLDLEKSEGDYKLKYAKTGIETESPLEEVVLNFEMEGKKPAGMHLDRPHVDIQDVRIKPNKSAPKLPGLYDASRRKLKKGSRPKPIVPRTSNIYRDAGRQTAGEFKKIRAKYNKSLGVACGVGGFGNRKRKEVAKKDKLADEEFVELELDETSTASDDSLNADPEDQVADVKSREKKPAFLSGFDGSKPKKRPDYSDADIFEPGEEAIGRVAETNNAKKELADLGATISSGDNISRISAKDSRKKGQKAEKQIVRVEKEEAQKGKSSKKKSYEPRKLGHKVIVEKRQRDSSKPKVAPTLVAMKKSKLKLPEIEKNESLDEMETRVYPLTKDEFNTLGGSNEEIKEYFVKRGASFPEYCNVVYNNKSKRLIVKNTPDNIAKIETILRKVKKEVEQSKKFDKGIPFLKTATKPVSTFSIDVDTASYTAARKAILAGRRPSPESVRPEEFINYFDYHYESPDEATFGVYLTAAPNPFRPQNYDLRVGVQGRKLGPDAKHPSVFTVLIDTSGSMAKKNRLELAKYSILLLLDEMKPNDQLSILSCGDQTQIWVDNMPVRRKKLIQNRLHLIQAVGETNLERGLVDAYQFARTKYMAGAFNRVIVFSDGIVHLGSKSAKDILKQVEAAREEGVTNTIIALGGDGDDKMMEQLANKGDGNYVFLDSEEEAENLFRNQFAAQFREIARDVKIQVEFDPKVVERYRQVGYQNRQLSKADFRNDKVDAGEIGAGQSVTALYEMILNRGATEDSNAIIATVRLRYRRVDTMEIEEKEFFLSAEDIKQSYDQATANYQLAAIIAEFAENLRFPDTPGIANTGAILEKLNPLLYGVYQNDGKVKELDRLIRLAK